MTRPLRLARLIFAFAVTFASVVAPPVRAEETCDALIAAASSQLLSVSSTYELLQGLDSRNCPKLSSELFDTFVTTANLNFVSYALLEARLSSSDDSEGPRILDKYIEDYDRAKGELDENALLPLIDVAYYSCKGDPACIRDAVLGRVGSMKVTALANCLFAMSGVCPPQGLDAEFPFLNDESLRQRINPTEALAERQRFICARYRACD